MSNQMKGPLGKVREGPKQRSFCPYKSLGVPLSCHMDAFTNPEALQTLSF